MVQKILKKLNRLFRNIHGRMKTLVMCLYNPPKIPFRLSPAKNAVIETVWETVWETVTHEYTTIAPTNPPEPTESYPTITSEITSVLPTPMSKEFCNKYCGAEAMYVNRLPPPGLNEQVIGNYSGIGFDMTDFYIIAVTAFVWLLCKWRLSRSIRQSTNDPSPSEESNEQQEQGEPTAELYDQASPITDHPMSEQQSSTENTIPSTEQPQLSERLTQEFERMHAELDHLKMLHIQLIRYVSGIAKQRLRQIEKQVRPGLSERDADKLRVEMNWIREFMENLKLFEAAVVYRPS